MRRLALALLCLLALAPAARAGVQPELTQKRATAIFVADPKVARWLKHYPPKTRFTQATYKNGSWTVGVWTRIDEVGEVATGKVDDKAHVVTEAWTGPQVAWKMARGYPGAFGGREINSGRVWFSLCAIFLIGLVDWRRLFSWRNLDLLVLVSFTVSLWLFNDGRTFLSMALAYPPLAYLLGRMVWSGWRGRGVPEARPVWPVWVLAAAAVFLAGFRIGLNVEDSNVIDVGYSGVVGADRIAHGVAPYGHFPVEDSRKPCGPADADGEVRDRIQTNGRCESANPQGDTYGPVAYEAYLPGYWLFGWTGKWDDLPAAHFTAVLADVLCLLGLVLVGLRFGGLELAATLGFAWVAWPFTQYVSSSNTNDALPALLLIWGFWLASSAAARGAFSALAGWTKFAPLLVAPLWLSYPDAFGRLREKLVFVGGFAAATLAAFSILLLDAHPLHEAGLFWRRTIDFQVGRDSPFSIWDWRQYRAGLPDLHVLQRALQVLLVAGAIAAYFLPRRKTARQLAALTAALLIGFEAVLTHWFYLYLPWFFPFVAIVVLTAEPRPEPVEEAVAYEHDRTAPVAAG